MQESDQAFPLLKNNPPLIILVLIVLAGFVPVIVHAQEPRSPVSQQILRKCEYLEQFRHIPVCSTCVASHRIIPAFYRDRDYRPAWTNSKAIARMIQAIESARDDGLMLQDYHYQAITALRKQLRNGPDDPAAVADLDMLLTDALLRLSYHLYYGKVNPESLDPDWNFKRNIHKLDPVVYLKNVIKSGNIQENLDKLRPQYPYYSILKENLQRYRAMAAHPWPVIPNGKVLKEGSRGPRVLLLRKRLAAEGYRASLKAGGNATQVFDSTLSEIVKQFQEQHALDADGAVGKNTLRELNIPASKRVDTIRVNLERARWILHDLEPEFLIVNIAGFKLYFVKNGKRQWQSKVMVGKPFWKTPCFRATIQYVVANPYWVVPPGILAKETIPKIKRDLSYLKKQNLEIVDSKGRVINPRSINWAKVNPRRFPYIIRQKPGPKNALGRIKFIFPNKHFVFLHDTPAKSLFSRSMRAFSHGCIRVEKPMELADILFKGSKKWNRDKIQEIINSGETTTIHLEHPMPILILYWTVTTRKDGGINFLHDIYNRDQKILIGLDTPLRIANIELPWQVTRNETNRSY